MPLLNLALCARIARRSPGWCLALLAPGVNVVVWALLWAEIAGTLGRSSLYGLGMAVPGVNLALLGRLAGWRPARITLALVLVAAASSPAAFHAARREAWTAAQLRAREHAGSCGPKQERVPVEVGAAALLEAARGRSAERLPDVTIVRGLAGLGPAALPQLVGALQDPDAGVRWHAAGAIMHLGGRARGAAPALLRAMSDSEWVVRNAAGRALEEVAAAGDVAALVAALREPSAEARYHAARALGRVGSPATVAIPTLIAALRDEDSEVRMESAWTLAGMGRAAAEAAAPLARALEDADPQVRSAAAWALARTGAGDGAAGVALRRALGDEDREVRDSVAKALDAFARSRR